MNSAVGTQAQVIQLTPQQVVDQFQSARAAGDVEAALAQFADSAVVTIQQPMNASYVGKERVRQFLLSTGVRFSTVVRSRSIVQGSSVTWSERDQFPEMTVDATVYAVINAGRITSLTYRQGLPYSTGGFAADANSREVPSLAWPAALVLIGVASLAILFGRPRRPASQSQLDGRLLTELRRRRELDEHDREQKAA